jgi:hypothetical protein
MSQTHHSRVHLDPQALNVLLEQFVNSTGQATVRFVDGRFEVEAQGLAVVVEQVTIDAGGVDVRWRLR